MYHVSHMSELDVVDIALYSAAVAAIVIIGLRTLGRGSVTILTNGLRSNLKWFIGLILVYLLNALVDHVLSIPPLVVNGTAIASQFFGQFASYLQQNFGSDPLTTAVSIIYLFSLSSIIVLTPLLFLYDGDRISFRTYCVAIIIAYVSITLIRALVPVTRPGLATGYGIQPLLYNGPVLGDIATDLGLKTSSFPSTHTTMLLITFLLLIGNRNYRTYAIIVGSVLVFVLFAVIYLGIHWPIDVLGGIVLGSVSLWVAVRLMRWREERSVKIEQCNGQNGPFFRDDDR